MSKTATRACCRSVDALSAGQRKSSRCGPCRPQQGSLTLSHPRKLFFLYIWTWNQYDRDTIGRSRTSRRSNIKKPSTPWSTSGSLWELPSPLTCRESKHSRERPLKYLLTQPIAYIMHLCVYTSMCIYIYVYIHLCAYTSMCIYIYVYIHLQYVYINIYIYIYIHVYIYIYLFIYIYIYIYTCIYIDVYMYMYIDVYIHVYVYIYYRCMST